MFEEECPNLISNGSCAGQHTVRLKRLSTSVSACSLQIQHPTFQTENCFVIHWAPTVWTDVKEGQRSQGMVTIWSSGKVGYTYVSLALTNQCRLYCVAVSAISPTAWGSKGHPFWKDDQNGIFKCWFTSTETVRTIGLLERPGCPPLKVAFKINRPQSSGDVWRSRWPSWAPRP